MRRWSLVPLAVCATPIGNLDDITLRVLAELRAADVVLAEDTRHTRGLLERHGIEARLLSYHEHNEAARVAELVPRLEAGERIALVTDAGMPGVSDPGARLVRAALDAGVELTVLPGRVGGRDGAGQQRARGRALHVPRVPAAQARRAPRALAGDRRLDVACHRLRVAEAPPGVARFARFLRSGSPGGRLPRVDEALRGDRARERRGAGRALRGAAEGRDHASSSGPVRDEPDFGEARAAVAELVEAGTPRRVAADVVARLTDGSRNELYRGSL